MMKYVISIVMLMLGAGVAYYLTAPADGGSNAAPVVPSPSVQTPVMAQKREVGAGTAVISASESVKADDRSDDRDLVARKQEEIQSLIQVFNENIDDPQARQEIKEKIRQLTAEYNQLVLPMGLEKMKRTPPLPQVESN